MGMISMKIQGLSCSVKWVEGPVVWKISGYLLKFESSTIKKETLNLVGLFSVGRQYIPHLALLLAATY